jgi:NADH:ubiquinone oxidoreductase subunit F (NADH-binding)
MTAVASPSTTARLLAGLERPGYRADLRSHLAVHGPLPIPGRHDRGWSARLIEALEASGLTGRGGGGFPTGAKLAFMAGQRRRPVVVVNATEGEPASHKDDVLASSAPHLVLDGAELVARALGATAIRVAVARDRPHSVAAYERALVERRSGGLATVADVAVVTPPARYITGEESALAAWLDGADARPTFRVGRPAVVKVAGRPALVDNAETLAHVALIGRHGPAWFREVGRPDAPGTMLVTVTGAVAAPGVFEVPLGTALSTILRSADAAPVAGVLVGGYAGAWVPADRVGTAYAPGPLAEVGAIVGPGVVVALDQAGCPLAETARVARWMAGEGAGQCGPCVFGLPAVADDLVELASGRASRAVADRLWNRLGLVEGRGACRHPDGVARMARSALTAFPEHLDRHLRHGPCPGARRPSVMTLPERDGWEPWR